MTLTATALREHHLADVYRYVSRRIARREDAEDITAECFADAFDGLLRFRGHCEPKLWLLGIARRKVADALRRRIRRPEVLASETDGILTVLSDAASPETIAADNEARQHLRTIVMALNAAQREALLLHYVDDLSQAEVAVVMGKSPAAVNSLLQRARAAVLHKGRAYFLDQEDGQ